MFSKRARLRAFEVKEILKNGVSVRAKPFPRHVSLKVIKGSPPFRAAVIVPKSIARGAVQRNRLRRAMYRVLHDLSPSHPVLALFFVQKVPPLPLTATFRAEASLLVQSIS